MNKLNNKYKFNNKILLYLQTKTILLNLIVEKMKHMLNIHLYLKLN